MVGTGRGAQLGILIKGPEVLESTRRVDTVVLDKTGTVTTGRMTLLDVVPADGEDADRLLRLAGALEAASEHPIAQAVARAAAERGAPAAGRGLRATSRASACTGWWTARRSSSGARACWPTGPRRSPRPRAGRGRRRAGRAHRGRRRLGRRRARGPRRRRRGQADLGRRDRPAARARAHAGPAHRRQRARRPHGGRRGRHRRGDRRGAAAGEGRRRSSGCRPRAGSWRWSATASTTPPRSPRPTSGWPWAPARTWRSRPRT